MLVLHGHIYSHGYENHSAPISFVVVVSFSIISRMATFLSFFHSICVFMCIIGHWKRMWHKYSKITHSAHKIAFRYRHDVQANGVSLCECVNERKNMTVQFIDM